MSKFSTFMMSGTIGLMVVVLMYVSGLISSSITFGLVRINNKPMMDDPVAKKVALKTMFIQPAVSAVVAFVSMLVFL